MEVSTVGIDFDGVIHWYRKGWHDGTVYDEPTPGAWPAIEAIQRRHAVFIFTCRDPLSVCHWMDAHSPFETVVDSADETLHSQFWDDRRRLLVTGRKLPAVAYIDDRAIRHTDWLLTQIELARLGLM